MTSFEKIVKRTNNPEPPTRMKESDFQVIGPLPLPGSGCADGVVLNLIGCLLTTVLLDERKLENLVNNFDIFVVC